MILNTPVVTNQAGIQEILAIHKLNYPELDISGMD
jgi:hypothetical protein